MASQERPVSGSSVIGIDVSSAHRSLLSATGAALNFAASFHRDAQACHGARERQKLHEIYRDKILAIDGIAANVAAAFLPVLRAVRSTDDGRDDERWGDFDRLAQRGKKMRDRESQHLQHQSGIIAAWGLECFDYYGWHALPLPLLRQLHDLAMLMPRWEDAVDVLNSKMLARHELRVLHGKNKALRVGEHSAASKVQAPHSPVERSDILAALEWAQTKATSATARQEVSKLARRINGTPIRQFGLKLDDFGMVVPSTVNNEPDDDDGGDDDVDDDIHDGDDHLGIITRPTKRTRLSSTGPAPSAYPDTAARRGPLKTRTRGGGHSIARDSGSPGNTEPPGPEESEESESESDDQAASDESSGYQHPTPVNIRVDEGGEENTSRPDSPDLYTVTGTRENSVIVGVGGLGEMEETGSAEVDSRSETEKTANPWSWSEANGNMVSGADEQVEDIIVDLAHSEQGIGPEEEADLEESIAGTQDIEEEAEEQEAVSISRDENRGISVTEDENQRDGERARRMEAGHEEIQEVSEVPGTSLRGHASGLDTVHGQNQRVRLTTSEGSTSQATSPCVAGSTVDTPCQATAAATRLRSGQPLAFPSGGDSIEQASVAAEEDALPLDYSVDDSVPAAQTRSSSVSPKSGSPPLRRPTLLQNLQERHADTVRQFIADLGRLHVLEDVVRQRRLQLDWLGPQRWARIYAEPEHHLGGSCVAFSEDADVWYLSWDAFRNYAESDYVFRRPVVIKQEFQDGGTYDIVDYIDMLWQRFPEQKVDVQNSMTGACSSMSLAKYCLAVADVDLSSSDSAAAISSVTNLRRLARADEPLLSRLPRFRLLSTLVDRVTGTVGRGRHLIPTEVEGCLGFNLLCFAGAFSGSYVDPLVGSWTRCLAGVQIVAVTTDLDADDWLRFSRDGRHWSPSRGQGRLIVLEQDDVLFMPPGLRAIRATFSPEPCLMEGRALWDECTIPETLDGLLWVVDNRASTDESIHVAFHLSPLIDALEEWMDDENYVGRRSSQATAAEQYQTVKAGIRSLRSRLPLPP
ncbi:hypothetical protein jhhlp_007559 [Lomentospora prolificans]|uniref:Uncharacterized protein n=1 Tax=Lomentospora prolificans TaxID=41688 RepID=A0A2N3MZY9_9PEZI|nr:hypothetical protein jhhlp_007559 [Lomentospora prolificans]